VPVDGARVEQVAQLCQLCSGHGQELAAIGFLWHPGVPSNAPLMHPHPQRKPAKPLPLPTSSKPFHSPVSDIQ
jgi:hypothetical protein